MQCVQRKFDFIDDLVRVLQVDEAVLPTPFLVVVGGASFSKKVSLSLSLSLSLFSQSSRKRKVGFYFSIS
jgi:hypothetical protein